VNALEAASRIAATGEQPTKQSGLGSPYAVTLLEKRLI